MAGNDDTGPTIKITRVPPNIITPSLVTIFGVICYAVVGLRLFTRACILKKLGNDDYIMLLALVAFTIYCAGLLLVHLTVVGRYSLTLDEWQASLTYLLITESSYALTIGILKISLAIFFLRAICIQKWHKYTVYMAVTLSSLLSVAFFFFTIFQCGTFRNILEFSLKRATGEKCVSGPGAVAMGYTHAIITLTTDLTFALLPMWVLKDTLMGKREKATVVFILTLAVGGSVASIVRLKFIPFLGSTSLDFYATSLGLGQWSLIEGGLGITAACLATLRPLFRSLIRPIRVRNSSRPSTPNKLRKRGYSVDSYGHYVRKSSISKPYITPSSDSKVELRTRDNPKFYNMYSPTSSNGEWDKPTLLESQTWEAQQQSDPLSLLAPLSRVPQARLENGRLVRYDRRNSYPPR
ncbi:hypothetical protein BT63DRAFT_112947 [Microthyrium microscopicum]|uniref:Rhodopsin domain-containing protein n=1 Tax=Microthyrium microscopicum TaxID=703497 RepID=A0A6A6TYB0_9PEZI|nr:hypothetical protein BT63DRAFT_112947 [Microthyrium microscopicum]